MKTSRSSLHHQGDATVKRALFALAAAILVLNSLVIPTVVRADGTPTSTSCGNVLCKP
jgi:hypothetical protein